MNPTKSPEATATPARKTVIYSEAFRRDSVAAWRASGLSVPKYAKEIGVHETSLYAWIRSEESPLPGVAGAARKPHPVSSRCRPKTANYAPNWSARVCNATF
jgi:transposase-like protein